MGNSSSRIYEEDLGFVSSSPRPLPIPNAIKQLQSTPHVQRDSLALVHHQGALSLACLIDAPTRCRVSLNMLAREDMMGVIDSTVLEPALSLTFQPGLSQPFPGTYVQPIDKSHIHSYLKVVRERFPIVIRVESLAPAYANYGLESLPPVGSAVTAAMVVHTVFAHVKLTAGSWDIEVIKEHLWVNGECYLLPSSYELAAYQTLAQPPRLALTTAHNQELKRQQQQLLVRQQLQEQQLQRQIREQKALKQQQQLLAAQQPVAQQQPYYPAVSQAQAQLRGVQKVHKQQQKLLAAAQQPLVQQPLAQQPLVQQPLAQQAYYPAVSHAQQLGLGQQLPLQNPQSQALLNGLLPPTSYPAAAQLPGALPLTAPLQSPFAGGLQSPFAAGGPGLVAQPAVPLPASSWPDVAQFA